MKKTVICSIPMKENVEATIYRSDDKSLPVADKAVHYPISVFLEKTVKPEDELKIISLVKKDKNGHYLRNAELFKAEIEEANAGIGAKITYVTIDSEFEESRSVHEQLMGSIVEELDVESHILADITYGPKDLPVVIFAALNFAEKFLDCSIDNIVYGQGSFVDGKILDTKICDMISLYCLGSVTNMIHCDEPEKAKVMLKALLSL